eukprot:7358151-Prymnesium_polylepis.1
MPCGQRPRGWPALPRRGLDARVVMPASWRGVRTEKDTSDGPRAAPYCAATRRRRNLGGGQLSNPWRSQGRCRQCESNCGQLRESRALLLLDEHHA